MTAFPLPLTELLGHYGAYVVYLIIGMAFGAVLESAGFGNSKKLAAQFYFKDLTVFKVMFTAIIVAMVLIFLSSAAGLLDYNLVWVPPTYLWPGIVGGLIMGVGFIVGGFCPGTSLVAMATGKVDGVFFVIGVLTGIFLFGETVSQFAVFFESSFMGRFTLPELFGLSYGSVVLAIVVVAVVYRDTLDARAVEAWVAETGVVAPLLFILIYALGTVLFLPGSVLTLAGGALFGPLWGTLYNLAGATLGASLAFLVARYLAGDWVEQRASGRLRRLKQGVEQEGWRFVAFVRLVPLFPFNLLNYALGLTRIRLLDYALASFIFMAPGALAYTYLGYVGREAVGGGEDLIRKSVGWMLREAGKRDEAALVAFLETHYHRMPRTTLRYAIEKFSKEDRKRIMVATKG